MSKLGILVCFPNPIVIMNHHGQMSCLFDDALPALGACSRYFVVERGTKSCQKVGKLFGVNCGYFGEAMFPLPKSISSKLRGETARLYTSVASSCYISSLRQPPRGTKPRFAHDQNLDDCLSNKHVHVGRYLATNHGNIVTQSDVSNTDEDKRAPIRMLSFQ